MNTLLIVLAVWFDFLKHKYIYVFAKQFIVELLISVSF